MLGFVAEHGYLEAIVRGYRCALLTQSQYQSLTSGDTVEDLRIQLSATTNGESLKNYSDLSHHSYNNNNNNEDIESKGITVHQLWSWWQQASLVLPFQYLQFNANGKLKRLLELMTHGYMIDNTVLVLNATSRKRHSNNNNGTGENEDFDEGKVLDSLLESCHPLGKFDVLGALGALSSMGHNIGGLGTQGDSVHVYSSILLESPLRPYFEQASRLLGGVEEVAALDAEFLRAVLGRVHLETFVTFVRRYLSPSGGVDDELDIEEAPLLRMLQLEADRRALDLCLNGIMLQGGVSGGRGLSILYPRISGSPLYPFVDKLYKVDDVSSLKAILDMVPEYRTLAESPLFSNPGELSSNPSTPSSSASSPSSVEDFFYLRLVEVAKSTFEFGHTYDIFYGWLILAEQELRNIRWIGECIQQRRKDKLSQYVPLF